MEFCCSLKQYQLPYRLGYSGLNLSAGKNTVFWIEKPVIIKLDEDVREYMVEQGYEDYMSAKDPSLKEIWFLDICDDPAIKIERDGGIAHLKLNGKEPIVRASEDKNIRNLFYSSGRDVDGDVYHNIFSSSQMRPE